MLKDNSYIVLLGDSTLDNWNYTDGKPSVSEHLKTIVSAEKKTALLAVDGSRIKDVYTQLNNLPENTTHLVLSVGGNDALSHQHILNEQNTNYDSVLTELYKILSDFKREYYALVDEIIKLKLPLIICTIYDGYFGDIKIQNKVDAVLAGFNDTIIRCAVDKSLPVIDLRKVCYKAEHFTMNIEPSAAGGKRFAETILNALNEYDFCKERVQILG